MTKYWVSYAETVYHDVLVEASSAKAAFQQVALGYTTFGSEANILNDDCEHEMEEYRYEVREDGKPHYTSKVFTFENESDFEEYKEETEEED